ncbi:MAG: hypothetical protein MJ201_01175 [Mycoplasmoidaceae bacterium]|nr:hypothetical protein [Mycoplasmoidaceae bacterium]
MKKILIPTLLTLSSTPLICLAGCNEPKEPIGDRLDFNTCDWSEIINACNKLEEGEITNAEFCKKFKFDSTPAKNLNDFVGKTRIVNINSQDHIVRVDGVKQDYLDETHEQPVVFTFEFENLISGVNGSAIKTK